MIYYKVPTEMDQTYLLTGFTLVKNELLTLSEVKRINAPLDKLHIVDINPRKTYWFFGCRFEM